MILFPAPDARVFGDSIVQVDDALFGIELDGLQWIFTDLGNWRTGGGVDAQFTARPMAHGAFDAPVWRRPRVIPLAGVCIAPTVEACDAAYDVVAGLLADGRQGTFTVSNARQTRSAKVRLSGEPLAEPINRVTFRWSLQFTATDHRRYGEPFTATTGLRGGLVDGLAYPLVYPLTYGALDTNGRITFTNSGNAPTEPIFTIAGPLTAGWEVTRVETGERLRYTLPVAASSPLTVDCAAGSVLEQGQRRERYLEVRDWPSVGPGETATFAFASLGGDSPSSGASFTVDAAPAFH